MTLEEQMRLLRQRLGSSEGQQTAQQKNQQVVSSALDTLRSTADQRPPLPIEQQGGPSIMDERQGFKGIRGMRPLAPAVRGARYLWAGDAGLVADEKMRQEDASHAGPVSQTIDRVLMGQQAVTQPTTQAVQSTSQSPSVSADRVAGMQTQPTDQPMDRVAELRQQYESLPTSETMRGNQAFAERMGPDGQMYVIGSQDDPAMRQRFAERQRGAAMMEQFNEQGGIGAFRAQNQAEMQRGAGDIAQQRENQEMLNQINQMPEGEAKQDALAQYADEMKARRESGMTQFDRFEGSKGSPDAKAREQRMANYQNRLDQLTAERVINKREARGMMQQAKKAEQEQWKFNEAVKSAEIREQDLFRKEALREAGIKSEEAITGVNASIHELGMSEGKKFKTGRFSSINLGDVNQQYNAMTPDMQFMVQKQAARLWSKDRDTNKDNMENFLSAFEMVQDMQLFQAKQNR